jgi:Derlin-2/3
MAGGGQKRQKRPNIPISVIFWRVLNLVPRGIQKNHREIFGNRLILIEFGLTRVASHYTFRYSSRPSHIPIVASMAANAAQLGGADSLSDWYRDIPPVTKFFITGTLGFGFAATFNLIPASLGGVGGIIFDWPSISQKFHFWRLITPFLFAGGFSMNFVFHLFMLYENCKRYEANPFNTGAGGTSADFLYMVLLGGIACIILGFFDSSLGLGLVVMSEPILYMIIYVWSRRDPQSIVNIWGFKFKALYLPWVYMGIRVLLGGSPTLILVGIAIGHLFYFLVDVVPTQHGYTLVKTPKFCVDFMTWASGSTQGNPNVYIPPARAQQQGGIHQQPREGSANAPAQAASDGGLRNRGGGGGYTWGRGNVLGGE